jgi:hypothetical protein
MKNLLKKPAKGGIPAIAKIIKQKIAEKKLFLEPILAILIKYLGCTETIVEILIKKANNATVKEEYIIM